MRILLDTHIFLWYISAHPSLPANLRDLVRDPANQIYLSAASVWEAVIKHSLGKLTLPEPPATYLPRQREAHKIAALAVEETAFIHLASLPLLHRDPSDRILMAQAIEHGLVLATLDDAIRAYSVPNIPTA